MRYKVVVYSNVAVFVVRQRQIHELSVTYRRASSLRLHAEQPRQGRADFDLLPRRWDGRRVSRKR